MLLCCEGVRTQRIKIQFHFFTTDGLLNKNEKKKNATRSRVTRAALRAN